MSNAATQRYLLAQRLPADPPTLAFQASHPARPGQFRIDILAGLEPLAQQAYLRDQEAVAALQHPHILPLVETASMPDGTAICVSRWPGTPASTLQGRLDAGAPLAPEAALGLITAVADALAAAHARGLSHGRLRADQILLPRDGEAGGPWLFGFGARHRLGDVSPSATDCEADLFDLANVAEQLLLPGAFAPAGEGRPSFGPVVEGILDRARQGSSETSFQSPLAFALALTLAVESAPPSPASSALDSEGALPMAAVGRKRRRHWVGLGVGAVAGAALTALLVLPIQPIVGWRASLRGWSLQAAPVMAESPPPARRRASPPHRGGTAASRGGIAASRGAAAGRGGIAASRGAAASRGGIAASGRASRSGGPGIGGARGGACPPGPGRAQARPPRSGLVGARPATGPGGRPGSGPGSPRSLAPAGLGGRFPAGLPAGRPCFRGRAMSAAPSRLGEILVDQGGLQPGDLDEALQLQPQLGRPLGEVLVALGMSSADDVARALTRQLGTPVPVPADPEQSCRQLLELPDADDPAPAGPFMRLGGDQVDVAALEALGTGFCALYGLLPLLSTTPPGAPEPQTIAAGYPVHPSVRSRLAARLHRPVTIVATDPLDVDTVLAVLQARAPAPAGARTLQVLASLEDDGAVEALAAAQARASALGLVTRAMDPGPLDWPLLPRGRPGASAIHVRSVQDRQLVLVTARPTPRLARAVAALHPGWAIAWEVALPEPPTEDPTWPNHPDFPS